MPAQAKGPKASKPKRNGRKRRGSTDYAIKVEKVDVRDDRAVCYLTLPNRNWKYTNPALAKRVKSDYRNIAQHACVNAKGNNFGSVMRRTPLPHLMEHLVIDILAGRSRDPEEVFTGFSTWVGSGHDKARVEVSMSDDVSTFKAVRDAVRYINEETFKLDAQEAAEKRAAEAAKRDATDGERPEGRTGGDRRAKGDRHAPSRGRGDAGSRGKSGAGYRGKGRDGRKNASRGEVRNAGKAPYRGRNSRGKGSRGRYGKR